MMIEITLAPAATSDGNIVNFYEYASRTRAKQKRHYSFEESLIMLGGYNVVSLSERRNK